jgi:hypothetical protein
MFEVHRLGIIGLKRRTGVQDSEASSEEAD